MKKHLTTILSFAMTLFMAFTLANCGSEVEINGNDNDSIKPGRTVFSTGGSSGTRTSMDADRYFYWEPGDNIWVNSTGSTYLRSTDNNIGNSRKVPACSFVFDAALTADTYPVLYTGNDDTSASATSVTIAAEQTQSAWNDASHLGKSGDCGTAEARKLTNGTYEFHLQHRAAYLVLKPYISAALTPAHSSLDLIRIDIEVVETTSTISGTYSFTYGADLSSGGLSDAPTTSAATDNRITLLCAAGFTLHQAPSNACFVVLHPGYHKLRITYYVQDIVNNEVTPYTQEVLAKNYKANGVTTLEYQMSAPSSDVRYYAPVYYTWDAPANEPYEHGKWNYNPVAAPTQASQSAARMPNVNEMYWYIVNGDCRWDNVTEWQVAGDPAIYTGGVWVKKKAVILADNTLLKCSHSSHGGNGPTFCSDHSVDGEDARVTFKKFETPDKNYYQTAGKPANTTNYFFLPSLGYRRIDIDVLASRGTNGYFWSSSPNPSSNESAYAMSIFKNYMDVLYYAQLSKKAGFVSNNWFK